MLNVFNRNVQVDSGLLGQVYLVGDDKVGNSEHEPDEGFQLTIGLGTEPSKVFRGYFCSIFQWRGTLFRLLSPLHTSI